MTSIKAFARAGRSNWALNLTWTPQFAPAHGVRQAQIASIDEEGLHVTIVRRKSVREFHITVKPIPGEPAGAMIQRLRSFCVANQATMVREEGFGFCRAFAEFHRQSAAAWKNLTWPSFWLEGKPVEHAAASGVHAFAIAGPSVEPIYEADRAIGSVFNDGYARHCIFGDLLPHAGSRADQAREIFDKTTRHLAAAGLTWRNVARTWLYLDRILEWYGDLNRIRKEAFERYDVFGGFMPASTGIGAANPSGRAIVAGLWAVDPLDARTIVRPVESPLQCSARDYGSCFSRAAEIITPDLRRLFVSGTASISPDGATEFAGDIRKQIARTFEVVGAILNARAMTWSDVSRATVYLKDANDAWAFAEYELEHGLNLPVLVTEADVCRDDLLFEIELDALAPIWRASVSTWDI